MADVDIETFRTEVREFLTANLTPELLRAAQLGFGVTREWLMTVGR